MINELIEYLVNEITSNVVMCYYDKAPETAKFPFCVIPSIDTRTLENRGQYDIDIDVYIMTSEYSNPNVEDIADDLTDLLDRTMYTGNNIAIHTNVESIKRVNDTEQDLNVKKVLLNTKLFKF